MGVGSYMEGCPGRFSAVPVCILDPGGIFSYEGPGWKSQRAPRALPSMQGCSNVDLRKLDRLMHYIAATKDRGLLLRPGPRYQDVSVYIDGTYGVHSDRKSHTGSCVVLDDVGAVCCKSSKQGIVTCWTCSVPPRCLLVRHNFLYVSSRHCGLHMWRLCRRSRPGILAQASAGVLCPWWPRCSA